MLILIFLTAIFLAINMGVSGFSVSFTPSYGSNVLTKNKAVILYTISLILGAILIGPRVIETLIKKVSAVPLSPLSGGIIITSCAIIMFISNLLKVPQSTSFIAVSSFVGTGFYFGNVNWQIVTKILIFALAFSLLSFFVTIWIKRPIYPPHPNNIKFYEKFFIHRDKFKKFIIFHDMYAGFSVGTNNVANVVAPLLLSLKMNLFGEILMIGVFFGVGAYLWGQRVIHSVSKDIIPVGEFSASIVSFITATFVVVASSLGLPTPYVQITTFSLLGISCIKDGFQCTLEKGIVKRILWVWFLGPLLTFFLSLGIHFFFFTSLKKIF